MDHEQIDSTTDNLEERYAAFVSYAHVDGAWAKRIHQAIENYRIPKAVAARYDAGRRIGKSFLDRSELATSSNLSDRITDALDRSDTLVLVCSPAAAASRWVNEEVRRFRDRGLGHRIFCLIVDGDPAATDDRRCFPPALTAPDADGYSVPEPLAADVRPGKDGWRDARLKVIAGLIDVPFDALRQREQTRRQRRLLAAVAITSVLLIAMTGLAISAVIARQRAERQEQIATRTADLLTSLFDHASPYRTGGRDVTVRSVIDQAATDTMHSPSLRNEPEVRANLLSTLAAVYVNLGLSNKAKLLIAEAWRMTVTDPKTAFMRVRTEIQLNFIVGDYARTEKYLVQERELFAAEPQLAKDFLGVMLTDQAQLARINNDPVAAERDFSRARRWALDHDPPLYDLATSALLNAAMTDIDNGREARGARRMAVVIEERRRAGQPLHPDVLTALNSLGAAAARSGDPVGAEGRFLQALPLQRRMFGDDSLDVALTRSNLGRSLVEQSRFDEALAELSAARAQFLAQTDGNIDTLANLNDSRGLALAAQGKTGAARASFAEGLRIARANEMPKEVELLIDRADLECASGDVAAGRSLTAAARRALARFGQDEPWRAARIDSVAGGCLIAARNRANAAALIRASTPVVIARWGPDSLFGRAAAARLACVDTNRRCAFR